MASATGSHPDTGSSVRPLPGSTNNVTPGRRPVLQHAQIAPLDRKRLRYRSTSGRKPPTVGATHIRRYEHGPPSLLTGVRLLYKLEPDGPLKVLWGSVSNSTRS